MLLELLQGLGGALTEHKATCFIALGVVLVIPGSALAAELWKLHGMSRRFRHLDRFGTTKSNMDDQFSQKYSQPAQSSTTTTPSIRIKALYLHPVKSCGAIEVDRVSLTKSGLLYDRRFAIGTETPSPDDKTKLEWKFLSQRTKPRMSQIKQELWLPRLGADPSDDLVRSGGAVVLRFDDAAPRGWIKWTAAALYTGRPFAVQQESLVLPLRLRDHASTEPKSFKIHDRNALGYDMSCLPSVAAILPKLQKYLGIPEERGFTIFRCTENTLVRTTQNLAPLDRIGSPAVHGYTDQQPVNINSLASVQAVSALLPPENQPLDALRFRANIWFTGVGPYEEESWKRFQIVRPAEDDAVANSGAQQKAKTKVSLLSVVCRTSRCTMPNVDLRTGEFSTDSTTPGQKLGKPQPSTTLKAERTVENANKKALGYLGMHCVPEDQSLAEAAQQGILHIRVGDEIEVLERGIHLQGSTADEY
jgi:uncharacterized protein YcbX